MDHLTQSQSIAVLVVDDEPIIADSVAQILNTNGFEATPAYNASSALELIELRIPNILLSDVKMPEMDGIELAKTVATRWPQVRIVLFSGHAATTDLLWRAAQEGYVFEALHKPINPERLIEALRP